MHKLRTNTQGFGGLEVGLVVLILIVLTSVGWTLYHKHTKSAPATSSNASTSNRPPAQQTDPTANWLRVDSIGGGYSIKIPDGWQITNYPDNVINSDNLSFSARTPAKVVASTTTYGGDQRRFNVGIVDQQSSPGPQWQSPNSYGTESTSNFSIGNLKGTRYSIEYTQTVTGVNKGDKVYQYVFSLPNDKQLGVVYIKYVADPDNLSTVEQAIKTIVIK